MKQDRFLMVILGTIGILAVLAVTLFFLRREPQTYGSDSTPEGVARNYVLALQNKDYQRAYGYLQETKNKPNLDEFRQTFLNYATEIGRTAVQIGDIEILGEEAHLELTIIHSNNAPFDRTWDENTNAVLIQQDGEWRIANMPYPYWGWEWYAEKTLP